MSFAISSNGSFTSYLQNPYYFMHASLVEKDTREDVLLIKDTRSKEDMHLFKDNRTKATTGSSVSSLYPLKDFEHSGTESGFFVFPDLSVRMEGTYRLKFCLYEMVGKDVHFCAYVISDPLVVYSAKKFPGMEESTLLSQYFAEQGLKIRIRKEVRPKNPTGSQQQDVADVIGSQEEEEAVGMTDVPVTSKRRASGTRSVENRRDGASPTTTKENLTAKGLERRSSQTGIRGGEPRSGQALERPDYLATSISECRRSTFGPHSQPPSYSEDSSSTSRRHATHRLTDTVSIISPSTESGPSRGNAVGPERWMDDYRRRSHDHAPAVPERTILSPLTSRQEPAISFRGGPPKLGRPGLEAQIPDPSSADESSSAEVGRGLIKTLIKNRRHPMKHADLSSLEVIRSETIPELLSFLIYHRFPHDLQQLMRLTLMLHAKDIWDQGYTGQLIMGLRYITRKAITADQCHPTLTIGLSTHRILRSA
ncbi:hypothetical protein EDD11_008714 [Mortierella claussenii]|nr:hypothetical protein EDD11_008714 [Mortierella claussenii]